MREPVRDRIRGQAITLGAAFGVFSGEVELINRRMRRPARRVSKRDLGRGFLANTPELAALAHLPFEAATVPGAELAIGRPVPPPPGLFDDDADEQTEADNDADTDDAGYGDDAMERDAEDDGDV